MKEDKESCMLCPRACKVQRGEEKRGYCGETWQVRAARASLHLWEEPCISGQKGSGTIFFSGCSLRCVFCQNKSIARGDKGRKVTIEQLAELFLILQDNKASTINLVTPTHFVPQIVLALERAKKNGLILPVVYNTASYEMVETIQRLEGLVDIYLPDMKYKSKEISDKYSKAPDYFEYASKAIKEMVRQVGEPVFEKGLMKHGVIVRHMVMPGYTKDSKEILKYLYETYGNKIYLSILNQYTPPKDLQEFPEIQRRVTKREYKKVVDYAIELGIERAFVQEGKTAQESFIPDFDEPIFLENVTKSTIL